MTTSITASTTRRLGAALPALALGLILPASALAANFVVTNLDDSGAGSLRQAILDANANGAADTITFAAPLAGGTIALSSGDLVIANDTADPDLTIDGDLDGDGAPDITVDAPDSSAIFFLIASGADATLEGLVITGSERDNASIISNHGTLTVANSTLSGNSGISDGGGINNRGTLTVTNSTISGNRTDFGGGGIFNDSGGTLTVSNSTISGNSSGSRGGGVDDRGTLTVTNSTSSGNSSGAGGGISNRATLTVTNSTSSGNSAILGGGIINQGTLTVTNSTISGNSAFEGGGILLDPASTGEIKGTIVAGNTATSDGADCFSRGGTITSLGLNLEGGTSCGFTATGDQQNVAVATVLVTDGSGTPLLADNGGPTQTIALLNAATNPALDAIPLEDCTDTEGVPVTTDQRGVARPQPSDNNCDIGAFELEQEVTTLVATKDSFLRKGNPDRDEGANPGLRLQAAGDNRVVVGFDAAAIDDFGSVTTATLVLTIAEIANNWGQANGRTVDAHPLTVDFAEGDGQNGGVPAAQSTRGSGPGVTWNCAEDTEIANQQTDCDPTWDGGDFGPANAPSVLHVNGLSGQVSWDVTADVEAGASAWLIKKTDEGQPGRVSYHSLQGADPALAPRLILEAGAQDK